MNRLAAWFGADEAWERPGPTRAEKLIDVRYAVIALLVAALGTELFRSFGALENESLGIGWQYLAVVSLSALVALRRIAPSLVILIAGVHLLAAGLTVPMTSGNLPMQMLYFLLIFSGIAWARDRRAAMAATGLVIILLVTWMAWSYALGTAVEDIRTALADDPDAAAAPGLLSPVVAVVLFSLLVNGLFFGFSIALGQIAWRGALRTHQVVEQSSTIEVQSAQLRDQAVIAERMRIARELHDVVAHHVSVMGVQAAAARRVMDRDPDSAKEALGAVETASREAVGQMRGLLGTLRNGDPEDQPPGAAGSDDAPPDRRPQPTLADLPALADSSSTPNCEVQARLVEDPPGAAQQVPPPVQLSTYRIVQEAIANVHRHSTARRVGVTVRVDIAADRVEVEVVDDGHRRTGTSGSGLGLLGMRERALHLGGSTDIGPRSGQKGWRVRVWFPLNGAPHQQTGPSATPDPSSPPPHREVTA